VVDRLSTVSEHLAVAHRSGRSSLRSFSTSPGLPNIQPRLMCYRKQSILPIGRSIHVFRIVSPLVWRRVFVFPESDVGAALRGRYCILATDSAHNLGNYGVLLCFTAVTYYCKEVYFLLVSEPPSFSKFVWVGDMPPQRRYSPPATPDT